MNIPVSEHFSINAELGVRYSANLSDDDSAIGGVGLGSINDTVIHIWVPCTLAAPFDF